jgi:predicted MFS family arabinose efflux permease
VAATATRTPLLRSRPLVALLTAEVLSTTGSQMSWLALPWFVLVTSGSKQMAFVIAAEAAGYAVTGLPSGSVLARLGPQRMMRLCDALRAPLILLVPLLHWSGDLTFPRLLALTFAVGAASPGYGAAQRVVVADVLDEDEPSVERANALMQGATRITMLCGPALAGVLIAVIGAPSVLLADAASYVVSFVLVTLFVPPLRRVETDETETDARGVLAGVRYLLRDSVLRGWTTAIIVGDAAFNVLFVAIPVLVVGHYGADPRLAGAFFASWGVGAVTGNVVAFRSDRIGGLRLAGWVVLVQAAPLWTLATPVPAAALAAALAVSGLANGLVNPTLHTFLTLRPPAAVRAKTLTATFTASTLGAPLALALAAPAFAAYGSRHVLAAAAAAQSAAMVYASLVTFRHLRRTEAAD